jgi:hypothetical protein
MNNAAISALERGTPEHAVAAVIIAVLTGAERVSAGLEQWGTGVDNWWVVSGCAVDRRTTRTGTAPIGRLTPRARSTTGPTSGATANIRYRNDTTGPAAQLCQTVIRPINRRSERAIGTARKSARTGGPTVPTMTPTGLCEILATAIL